MGIKNRKKKLSDFESSTEHNIYVRIHIRKYVCAYAHNGPVHLDLFDIVLIRSFPIERVQ